MSELVFYILIFAVLGLISVIVMFLHAYLKLHAQMITLTKQNMYLKNQDAGRAEQILSEAHDKAVIIIDEANKKAASVLMQAQTLDDTAASSMEKRLDDASKLHAEEMKKASSALLALYIDALQKIQSEEIQSAKSVAKDINKISEQQIGQFKDILAKETVDSEKLVEGKITTEYTAIENELKAYKERRLAEIDNDILQVVQSVTEVVLQKQLSVSDQEQLVYDALTKMKQQTRN